VDDRLRPRVRAGGGHFEHTFMIRHNILLNCQCNLTHVTAIL